ncbi:hypothetical protein HPB50_001530 [Hyalomma asiaticum]|uniref:Uncharacterized protein n=1 Tax=Hyalomma asiaticum TaxID=266040 RepID=A0ACB7SIQ0_HYAAI|nr:hypothetical protein HPB50_001530 [Hyalomma asiaticum]
MEGPKEVLHSDVRAKTVSSKLKKKYLIYNVERRKCRTKAILKNHGTNASILFVDATRYLK